MKTFTSRLIGLGLMLSLGASALPALAAQYKLSWEPVEDPRVLGYRVYYGQGHRDYDQWVDVGNVTSYTFPDLDPNQVYSFAVKSHDGVGQESQLSTEVTSGYFRFVVGMGPDPLNSGQLVVLNQNQDTEREVSVTWSAYNQLSGEARVATGDIDGDGRDEVVIGFGPVDQPGLPEGRFLVLDDDFSFVRWGQVDWPDYNVANGETRPALGDIDGDGKDEIVIGLGAGGNGMLQVFRYADGELASMGWAELGWPDYEQANGETWPSLGDIDGDGLADLAIGVGSGGGGTLVIKTGFDTSSLETGGNPSWQNEIQSSMPWAEYAAQIGETRPALGDLTGDGTAEIVVGLGQSGGGYLEIFDYQDPGLVHMGTAGIQWPDYNAQNGETRPALGDIDLDGRDEIIVGLGTGGAGYVDLLDDESWQYASLGMLQIGSAAYQAAGGESWPAFKRERLAAAPPVEYRLTLLQSGTGSGTVGGGGLFPAGTIVSPSASAGADSTFSGWTPTSCGSPFALNADTTCTATFTLLPSYALTVSRSGSGSGSVISSPAGIDCGSDCSESYVSGTAVTLTAAPASSAVFGGWSGACSGTSSCLITMSSAKSVTATFNSVPSYQLTVKTRGSGMVTSSPAGIDCGGDCTESYAKGTAVTLTASPVDGFRFTGWSGACSGTQTCRLSMSRNLTVTATFRR
ncbi:InlB B-repeat-containing protein [Thiocapsa sp. UBA6158]|jgi:hypothetical protein|uniref:InlB B-repeat-containing protein n=1 Tax=Thiocapsa sp. UBA6158 TaxID=1947692 RepID=UPI0025E17290|nr:FG-GAP-like repeat-containing protein [Thiocapsa sp. UBA6158]